MQLKNKQLLREACYINGQWLQASEQTIIEIVNPATQAVIARVPNMGKRRSLRMRYS